MIQQILALAEKKRQHHHTKKDHERTTHVPYLEGITAEIQEAADEIKSNNQVYLEDELGDVLWDYLNILTTLKHTWYISSETKVFERCKGKYQERLEDKINSINRADTKTKQKENLKKEHDTMLEKQ